MTHFLRTTRRPNFKNKFPSPDEPGENGRPALAGTLQQSSHLSKSLAVKGGEIKP